MGNIERIVFKEFEVRVNISKLGRREEMSDWRVSMMFEERFISLHLVRRGRFVREGRSLSVKS